MVVGRLFTNTSYLTVVVLVGGIVVGWLVCVVFAVGWQLVAV